MAAEEAKKEDPVEEQGGLDDGDEAILTLKSGIYFLYIIYNNSNNNNKYNN